MDKRLSRPFSFIRTLTVGFGIAPNLLALPVGRKALAGLGFVTFTAGGEFHPALRTLTRPGMGGLFGTMANGGRGSKGLRMENPHVAMPQEPDWKRQNGRLRQTNQTRPKRIRRAGLACRESDSGLFPC
jgi:hypothetical protein